MKNRFGTRYEVTSLLGKGGMGEVYRAHDRRLRREVAIKTLPEVFAQDPERVTLFQREAQLIASLNHPNIAAIHELEESAGARWLVLELVQGETLEERLKRGPLAMRDALSIARQICDGLEAAHEKGVIHRDLKPSNIKITPDDKVKLLDFGLASAFEVNPRIIDQSNTPTLRTPSSVPAHCGTATYMAPEQFQWKTITKQVDIWAFGCVLFEMLTAQNAFLAETLRETATLILETEPDWKLLDSHSPAVISLIQRCLQKDRRTRLHDIADARIEIDRLLTESATPKEDAGVITNRRPKYMWPMAAALFAAGALVALMLPPTTPAPAPAPAPVRFSIPVSQTNSITQIAVSPDGRKIAYVAANTEGIRLIWIRHVDVIESRPLLGTDDPSGLFWSPDSQQIAFLSDQELKAIDVSGTNLRSLSEAPGATSGTWGKAGDILIDGPAGDGLYRLTASGGVRTRFTSPNVSRGERHFQPHFLPDGRQFLFLMKTPEYESTGIYIASLDSPVPQFLLNTTSKGMFSAPGHLFFVREGTLFRQLFDWDSMRPVGELVRIVDRISTSAISGSSAFSVSPGGVLAFRSGAFMNTKLQWLDRSGKEVGVAADPAPYTQVSLSGDEKYIAAERRDPDTGEYDIWLVDPARATSTRLTFDPSSERHPVWFGDNQQLAFSSDRFGLWALFRQRIDANGQEELIWKGDDVYYPMDFARGNLLLFRDSGRSFFSLNVGSTLKPEIFMQTSFAKSGGRLSPNGKWFAYITDDTEREVNVVSFPKGDFRRQISSKGGVQPIWSGTGKELFYLDMQGNLMAASIDEHPSFQSQAPKVLFRTSILPAPGLYQYAVGNMGTRFLTVSPMSEPQTGPIEVVLNSN